MSDDEFELLDGTYLAVLDRFEEDVAVLLIEDDDRVVAEELVNRRRLPADGRHQDAVFKVRFDDGEVVSLTYDPETTEQRSRRAQDRFDRLSKRLPRDGTDGENDPSEG